MRLLLCVVVRVTLESSEQEWSEDGMQSVNDEQFFFLVEQLLCVVILLDQSLLLERLGKPLGERLSRVKDRRQKEVEQTPQLEKRILKKKKERHGEEESKSEQRDRTQGESNLAGLPLATGVNVSVTCSGVPERMSR